MRVLLLITLTPNTIYFANRIVEERGDIVGAICEKRSKDRYKAVKSQLKSCRKDSNLFYCLTELAYLSINDILSDRSIKRILFKNKKMRLSHSLSTLMVENINGNEALDFAKEHRPDVLAVYCSSILKSDMLSVPKMKTVSVHTGIVPKYRGMRSEFWALYNMDFDMIGSTILSLDEDIDTGEVLAQETVSVESKDDERSLRAKNAIVATSLMLKVLNEIEKGKCNPMKQSEIDHSYFSRPRMSDYLLLHKRLKK